MIDQEILHNYCMSKAHSSADFPFDEHVLVYRVHGKIFALCDIDEFEYINLKCDPEEAIALREAYDGRIRPAFHMSKKHWNSVDLNAGLKESLIFELIDKSYALVYQSLPKKVREQS